MLQNIDRSRWGYLVLTPVVVTVVQPKRVASLSLTAHAVLTGPGARVTITQRFVIEDSAKTTAGGASSEDTATEATYLFPLPDGAAVCEFECVMDDRTVVGVVREKQEAREEYQKAVAAGNRAALLEQHVPDVFQVSLGNTQKSKTITTKITYVQELSQNAEDEEIRFSLLSKNVKERYGVSVSNTSLPDASSLALVHNAPDNNVPVSIALEMPAPILSLQSPSHSSMVVGMGSSRKDAMEDYDPRKARIELDAEGAYPDKELVVIAKVKDLNKPSCMVETHPVHGTHAVALTMVPRFALNEIRTEIIVLVDRSGSMQGRKIQQASAALEVLLKSIPPGCYFNIIGFGSTHQPLFPASKEYTSTSLKAAEKHCQNLQADLGGTEIQSVLEYAMNTRRKDMPTQVFVLTDGEVWNVEELLESLRRRVEESEKTPEAFARVFALGIGNDVSHHLVEGISRVGGGFAQFVGEDEKLKAKVVKMLKAAVLPPIVGYEIDWTDGKKEAEEVEEEDFEMIGADKEAEKRTLSFFSADPEPKPVPLETRKMKVAAVQQAPFKVPNLWPGMRFHAYAILSATTPPPAKVTITATSTDGPIKLIIPVVPASPGTLLHTLAARKLIQDIDDNKSHLATSYKVVGPVPSTLAKEEMVRLGKTYGIASRHTSFLAVDNVGKEEVVVTDPLKVFDEASSISVGFPMACAGAPPTPQASFGGAARSAIGGFFGRSRAPAPFYTPTSPSYSTTSSAVASPALLYTPTSPSYSPTSSAVASFSQMKSQSFGAYPAPGGGGTFMRQSMPVNQSAIVGSGVPFGSQPQLHSAAFAMQLPQEQAMLGLQLQQQQQQPPMFGGFGMMPQASRPPSAPAPLKKRSVMLSKSKESAAPQEYYMDVSHDASAPTLLQALSSRRSSISSTSSDEDEEEEDMLAAPVKTPTKTETPETLCHHLITLQFFNGSFPHSSIVSFLPSISLSSTLVKDLIAEFGVTEEIAAVAVAVAVFRVRFGEFEEEWDMVVGKAVRFGVAGVGADVWEKVLEGALKRVKV
ncbi:hypothetical protein HDU67_007387 [Dinochytrium kinnereticum]|nr:hypothetical protein HDU67_007387 [Dinochytrium kinnereticum]